MAPPKLYTEMVTFIESMITSGAYPSGSKLPTQRELCEKFALSKGTVGRGLDDLEQRGLIIQRHGAGAFVRQSKPLVRDHHYQIGILIEEYDGDRTYCGHILRGVQLLAAERNCGLHLNFTAYTDFNFDSIRHYMDRLDGLILIGVYDTSVTRLPRNKPCVGVNMCRSYGFASIVDLDPVAAADLAIEHFARRHIRRVICYTVTPDGALKEPGLNSTFRFRSSIFQASWPGECIVLETDERHEEIPEEWLNSDTGFLFVSGSRFEKAARAYLERTGRQLTDDACVLSIDGKSLLVPDYLPVDTIATDYTEMGKLALSECLRRIDSPGTGPRRIYQNVRLAPRN